MAAGRAAATPARHGGQGVPPRRFGPRVAVLTRSAAAALLPPVALYFGLALTSVQEIGRVGEVAIGWTPGSPPQVAVDLDPARWADGAAPRSAGHRLGPWVASQTRPVERLEVPVLGGWPWMINAHTGGLPDWPARLAAIALGDAGPRLAHLIQGLGVLLATAALGGRAAGPRGAVAVGLCLASSWPFIFYRNALGGTENVLLAAVVGGLWAVEGARAGRPWALPLGALAVAAGVHAKLSFVASAAAIGVLAWTGPRGGRAIAAGGLGGLLGLLPAVWTAAHHRLGVDGHPHVFSHDFPAAQLARLGLGAAPAREQLGENLRAWAVDPLTFLERAYGAAAPPGAPPIPEAAAAGAWGVLLLGAAAALRSGPEGGPHRRAAGLLLLQVPLLLLIGRDLHHLGQAAPALALAAGLGAERLGRRLRVPRLALAALLCPAVLGGVYALMRTDPALRTVPTLTFTRSGQAALAALVRGAGVQRLTVCDYEAMGALDPLLEGVTVEHAWGAASRRPFEPAVDARFAEALLAHAAGGHLLLLRASAPMVYNLGPEPRALQRVPGFAVEEVGALPVPGGKARAATLLEVRAIP